MGKKKPKRLPPEKIVELIIRMLLAIASLITAIASLKE